MIIRSLLVCAILLVSLTAVHSLFGIHFISEEFNMFSIRFFKTFPTSLKENVVICPFCIVNILNSLYYGSRNKTAKEIRNLLSFPDSKRTREEFLRLAEIYALSLVKGKVPEVYVFNTTNAILINQGSNFNVLPNYRRAIEKKFMVTAMTVDLNASPEEILSFVNPWVSARASKIRYYDYDIDSTADLIVLSGAYFKAPWQNIFHPLDTMASVFYNEGLQSKAKFVPTMHMTNNLRFYSNNMLSIIELPFLDGFASMYIYLPHKLNGLKNIESNFHVIFFNALDSMKYQFMSLSLPKFQLSYSTLLSPSFYMMGAREIFQPHSIDLSRMVGKQKVIIGEMNHRVFLSVTEWGLDVKDDFFPVFHVPEESTPFVRVNRPFLFVIADSTPSILLMGRVQEL